MRKEGAALQAALTAELTRLEALANQREHEVHALKRELRDVERDGLAVYAGLLRRGTGFRDAAFLGVDDKSEARDRRCMFPVDCEVATSGATGQARGARKLFDIASTFS